MAVVAEKDEVAVVMEISTTARSYLIDQIAVTRMKSMMERER